MVVALEVADVVELRVDARAERAECAEVLRRAGHVEPPARGNLPRIHLEGLRGVQAQLVVEHRAARLAREVEVDVVREVHDRRPVGPGQVGDLHGVVVVEVEDRLDVQLARVALVAVLREERHHHAVGLHAALPDAVGKVLRPAVQVVAAVVDLQRVGHAVDRHASAGDAVGAAAHALARGGTVVEVALGMLVAQYHVGHAALAVGHREGDDRSAEVREAQLRPLPVGQRVEDDCLALRGHAPDMLFDRYHVTPHPRV